MENHRNFLTNPAYRVEETGKAIPDSPHAVSVCLPTWQAVLAYEEGEEWVVSRMEAGYPRFFLSRFIKQLREEAFLELGLHEDLDALPFPSVEVAREALDFVEREMQLTGHIVSWKSVSLVVLPKGDAFLCLARFWRYTGLILSSRCAEDLLHGMLKAGDSARFHLKQVLAEQNTVEPKDLFHFPSGMGAIFAAYRVVCGESQSQSTLQVEFPYTDLYNIQANFGKGVEFPDLSSREQFESMLEDIRKQRYSAVFTELPSNPLCRSVNLVALSAACREAGVPLVVDDTIASSYNVDVKPYADLVTTSLTKWHAGSGDVIAGQVWLNPDSPLADQWRLALTEREQQSPLYEGDAQCLLPKLAGFATRMQGVNRNGLAVYEHLKNHPSVESVWYPAETCRSEYDLVKTKKGGFGGLMSITFREPAKAARFFDRVRFSKGPSLGTEFSLACPYTLLAHYTELDWVEQRGVSRNLVRLSIGIENLADLLSRLDEALQD